MYPRDKRHVKQIFRKKFLTWKMPYKGVFWLWELWSAWNPSKMSILRAYKSIFLAKTRSRMIPTFQPGKLHNHTQSLYRTDFWNNSLFDFKLHLNVRYEPKLRKMAVKAAQNATKNGSKTLSAWIFLIIFKSFLTIVGRF